ncbi:hypothetical protein S245_067546, partial [Arachis hypogaea]
MSDSVQEARSLALTPTWSVPTVLTIFVAVSLLVERSIHQLSNGYEPFVSYEGLEQLHRFIFVMAITHISYSCLTMLLAIVKIHSWRVWEDEAHMDQHGSLAVITRELTMRRQSSFVKVHTSNPMARNSFLVWVCLKSLAVAYSGDLLLLSCFPTLKDQISFWIAIIPVTLVLLVGTKLQHVIATLALENAGITGYFSGSKLRPRNELFWFNKPELLLSLIHFILFQNAFKLASFFWFWWQFGYNSCFIRNHLLVYLRLILGFAGQFLCSYSTLPLYALLTQ